ncbi:hypothetical protein HCN44_004686 [Aphidius gifuensis]|uniref:Uncharacterized protein n=1 Tax=Aphidius gifuensis TaxID=684658 RepID=A0A834Y165_APHGI|nr:hypothetical protein HCN44_004686 [Aphidius gifuensis]
MQVGVENYTGPSESMHFYRNIAFNCGRDKVWLLKSKDERKSVFHNMLDALSFYNETKVDTVRQIDVGFDNATSISYDWSTKRIYWSEYKNGEFSIKGTDESFNKTEYIISPKSELDIEAVKVYPKQKELFFLSDDSIWYTPIEKNSTASLLFSREQYSGWIYEFSIDYATNKLYWVAGDESNYNTLYCVDILTTARPFTEADIEKIKKLEILKYSPVNLVALNNTLYWIAYNRREQLYYKNGNETAVRLINLSRDSVISFISAICPSIISLAFFAVCFIGLPVCTNTKNFQSNEPEIFLLFSTKNQFYTLHNPTIDAQPSNVEIEYDNSFENYNNDFTFNCANNNIYVLTSHPIYGTNDFSRALDVIHYKGNNKFERIDHVKNIFEYARSIASDWTTEELYWIEHKNGIYSIKFIDKSFKQPKYIIHFENRIKNLNVYPKRGELFFLSGDNIWYTSNQVHSIPKLLFDTQYTPQIYDIAIDYATDKLYWIEDNKGTFILKCIVIGNSRRPLQVESIVEIEKLVNIHYIPHDLVAFNDALYWIAYDDE